MAKPSVTRAARRRPSREAIEIAKRVNKLPPSAQRVIAAEAALADKLLSDKPRTPHPRDASFKLARGEASSRIDLLESLDERLRIVHATLDLVATLTDMERIEDLCDGTLNTAVYGAMLQLDAVLEDLKKDTQLEAWVLAQARANVRPQPSAPTVRVRSTQPGGSLADRLRAKRR